MIQSPAITCILPSSVWIYPQLISLGKYSSRFHGMTPSGHGWTFGSNCVASMMTGFFLNLGILFLHRIRIPGVQLPFILKFNVDLWLAVDHDHTRLVIVFLVHQRF